MTPLPDQITRHSKVTTYRGGSGIHQHWEMPTHKPNGGNGGGGVRKEICGLSRASRKKLNDYLATLNVDQLLDSGVYHSILTIPQEYRDTDYQTRSGWLDSFKKKLQYRYRDKCLAVVVRQELSSKKTGHYNPHYHLLLVLPEVNDAELGNFISEAWYKSCGRLSEDHRKAGTTTRRIRSRRYFEAVRKYLGAREKIHHIPSGRCWTVWNRKVFEEHYIDPERVEIPDVEGDGSLDKVSTRLRRILGKVAGRNLGERYFSSMTYLSHADVSRLLCFYGVYPYLPEPPGGGDRLHTYLSTLTPEGYRSLLEDLDSRGLDFFDIWPELGPPTVEEDIRSRQEEHKKPRQSLTSLSG